MRRVLPDRRPTEWPVRAGEKRPPRQRLYPGARRRKQFAHLRRPALERWHGRCHSPRPSPKRRRARGRKDCSAHSWLLLTTEGLDFRSQRSRSWQERTGVRPFTKSKPKKLNAHFIFVRPAADPNRL